MTYIIYWASDRFMSQVASGGPHKFTSQVSHTLVKDGLISRSHAPPRGYTVWPPRVTRGYTVFSWPRCIFLKFKKLIFFYKILFSSIRKSLILRNFSLIFKFRHSCLLMDIITWRSGTRLWYLICGGKIYQFLVRWIYYSAWL